MNAESRPGENRETWYNSLDLQKEQSLAECLTEIKKHEFQADYDRRSVQKLSQIIESQQEELNALKQKNFNYQINNFFIHN